MEGLGSCLNVLFGDVRYSRNEREELVQGAKSIAVFLQETTVEIGHNHFNECKLVSESNSFFFFLLLDTFYNVYNIIVVSTILGKHSDIVCTHAINQVSSCSDFKLVVFLFFNLLVSPNQLYSTMTILLFRVC